jgi:hypothetical protein
MQSETYSFFKTSVLTVKSVTHGTEFNFMFNTISVEHIISFYYYTLHIY